MSHEKINIFFLKNEKINVEYYINGMTYIFIHIPDISEEIRLMYNVKVTYVNA